jgi:hypothetical protein
VGRDIDDVSPLWRRRFMMTALTSQASRLL